MKWLSNKKCDLVEYDNTWESCKNVADVWILEEKLLTILVLVNNGDQWKPVFCHVHLL